MLETIWEGSDEDRTSTAASLLVHDENDEALTEGGENALRHLVSDGESTRYDSDHPDSSQFGCESLWSPRSDVSIVERRRPDFDLYPSATRVETTVPDHLYHVRCASIRSGLTADHLLTDVNESADMHYRPEMVKYVQEEVEKIMQECAEAGRQRPTSRN